MSITREHAEWRSLVEVSGPFLNLDVLARVFPQGLDKPNDEPTLRARLRAAHDEWEGGRYDAAIHQAWIQLVLLEALELSDDVLRRGQCIPANLEVRVTEHDERLRPDIVLIDPATDKPRLLLMIVPPRQKLERAVEGQRWMASPSTRMMTLLHGADIRLGLVTNGEEWMMVRAAPNETTTFASFYATLWLEEPTTLRAFRSLLGVRRFFSVDASETLEAMFAESAKNPHEVTDQLGLQVRRAVELLVQAIDRVDRDRGRKLLAGALEQDVFEAAVTVMMRLVFLLAAEERRLIPSVGQALYDQHYAISTLREQLRQVADQHGEEVLERRRDAWSRLLATFRAVHGGIQYQDLRLIAYGGSLFDPDRFPFLEGRAMGTRWRDGDVEPLPIDNRTVLHLLEALQLLELKVPGGGPAETQRLSFRSLGVEQIGHVYEGLLDHAAVRATEPVLGLRGSKKLEPEIPLSRLDAARKKGDDALVALLKEETGRSPSALQKDYMRYDVAAAIDKQLRSVCSSSPKLYGQVKQYAGLLRTDSYGQPVVVSEGSVYVTQSSERRLTGTHYTPPSLTEPLVQHTLDPLMYVGPAEGKPREEWKLRTAAEILKLRVCDIAMGSGAFLVQACRYLAARLVEAWAEAERASGGKLVVTPEGQLATGHAKERPLPTDVEERLVLARRYVADRCIYGVDINPMAVEIAKLSMWLTTLQKDRPFTFLDHALRPGDSLLGVTAPEQLEYFNLRPDVETQLVLQGNELRTAISHALEARRKLESFTVVEIGDADEKARLLHEAESAMSEVRILADLLVGSVLDGGEATRASSAIDATAALKLDGPARAKKLATLQTRAEQLLHGRRPFHWLVEFPEVLTGRTRDERGFDATVGNPPFVKGHFISTHFGHQYRDFIVNHLNESGQAAGLSDLVAFFFARAYQLLRKRGGMGLLSTNTIEEGDTNEVGIGGLVKQGGSVYRVRSSFPWPGEAAVIVSAVHVSKGKWTGIRHVNGAECTEISTRLSSDGEWEPFTLAENADLAFNGFYPNGEGFVVDTDDEHWASGARYRDVIYPYITGVEMYASSSCAPERTILYFFDWSEDRVRKYSHAYDRIRDTVKPLRQAVTRKRTREAWWLYAENRPGLAHAIGLGPLFAKHPAGWTPTTITPDRVIAKTKTSQTWAFVLLPSKTIFDQSLVVIARGDYETFGVLQSSIHWMWAVEDASRHKTDVRYSPSHFETFPRCVSTADVAHRAVEYYKTRERVLEELSVGLTGLGGMMNDPSCSDARVVKMRELHAALDDSVLSAYGWAAHGLRLEHGFHPTKRGVRFGPSERARKRVLELLLALNRQRHGALSGVPLGDKVPAEVKKPTRRRSIGAEQKDFEF